MQASRVLPAFIYRVAAAVIAGGWETSGAQLGLPPHRVPRTAAGAMAGPEKPRQGQDDFRATRQTRNVTDCGRLVDVAVPRETDLIRGRTEITRRRDRNRWRTASIANAPINSPWPPKVLRLAKTFPGKGPAND